MVLIRWERWGDSIATRWIETGATWMNQHKDAFEVGSDDVTKRTCRYFSTRTMKNDLELAVEVLEGMISRQQVKVLESGRKWVPHATDEDLRNAEDFAILKDKPIFHYEDGILAGLVAAKTALAHELKSRRGSDPAFEGLSA